MSSIIFDHQAVEDAIGHMADAIQGEQVHLIGIQRGGAKVANALQQLLEARGTQVCRGNLDISFYRDDLDTIAPNPEVKPSQLPHDFNGKTIWLIDDVLYTGRTIRAALGEIFDYGRPAAVKLAVLVNRGGHQLPIAPDLVGLNYNADPGCSIKLVTAGPWYIEQRDPSSAEEQ